MNKYTKRQIEIVEFSAKVYHSGLRHTGINGTLYENKLIQYLRTDIPEFDFYRGQLKSENSTSSQYDIIVCKKGTLQIEFLKEVDPFTNIVNKEDCVAVIELKKWGNPKMISTNGVIAKAFTKFKLEYPELNYILVCLRFKNRKKIQDRNWEILSKNLNVDQKFCFFGNTYHSDKEWEPNWLSKKEFINRHQSYLREYERLINFIKTLPNIHI